MRMRSPIPALLLSLLCAAACCAAATVSAEVPAEAPARSAADRERDARDHPAEVLAFAGIKRGDRVADVFGGAGYYSELLQQAVGDSGHVLLLNNGGYQAYAKQGQAERFADGRLAQVERRVAEAADLGLGEAQFDAIVMVMAFHDVYWVDEKEGWPAIDRSKFNAQLARALKPGGVLLIVDHAARDGTGMDAVNALHRIDEAFVRRELEQAGLSFDGSLDLLRHPEDDRSKHVFDAAIRGNTDRFVHRYRKAAKSGQ